MARASGRRQLDGETTVFILFFVGMALYYGWRMFGLTPWYDELYTYYYFISRGPVYAAIHWPLPNNHIGYSVLSACLGIFGNAAVALRGVSWLCSLGSLILLFRIARRCFARGMALIPVFLYTGMKLVNQLAVQGRGYALVTFCYLAAIWELLQITAQSRTRIRDYVCFGASLTLALWAIPSSLYVVVPVCLAGGIVLLVRGAHGRLVRLIAASLAGAVCTVGLYGVVWLAIGANLITKINDWPFYQANPIDVILQAPFRALREGIDYMLATPYIQSAGRDGFLRAFAGWLRSLLNEYYMGGAPALAVLLIVCEICVAFRIGKKIKNRCYKKAGVLDCGICLWQTQNPPTEEKCLCGGFLEIFLAVSVAGIPLMLVIMCSMPYYRVLSFAGATVALALTWLWQTLAELVRRSCGRRTTGHAQAGEQAGPGKYPAAAGSIAAGVLCAALLFCPAYLAQYSDREAAVEDAWRRIDLPRAGKIAVTDCDQEYLLLFLYGIDGERVTRSPAEAEVVLADKYLLLDYDTDVIDWSGDAWKLYLTREEFAASQVTERMEAVYENDRFILYQEQAKSDE